MRAPTLVSVATRSPRKTAATRAKAQHAPLALPTHLPVLPKLKFGQREDAAEHDADRTADRVVALDHSPAADVGAAVAPAAIPAPLPPPGDGDDDITSRILRALRFGRPLPVGARTDMEARFGTDFSSVRVHTDAESAAVADEINAHAFALGEHIAFAEGAFNPDSTAGRHLLAHELTHVVQARETPGATHGAVHRDESQPGTISRWLNSAGEFIASQGRALVRSVAPPIVMEVLDEGGPLQWLQRKLGLAFDALVDTVSRIVPMSALDELGATFGALLQRASAILAALVSGDCQPLFDAIDELKTFVTEVAGRAWDKLVDFLRPVGTFFTNLWNGYGAPAVAWLEQFGGRVWDEICRFGRQLWDSTAPIRRAAAGAWTWFKGVFFGTDDHGDGESSEGIFGWIMRKAGEAWNWVKEQTRPVWQPVVEAFEFVRDRIPPPFLTDLSRQMQQLSGDLQNTAGQMEAGAAGRPIAENRDALAAALPSIQQIIASVRAALVSAGQWLTSAIGGVGAGVANFMGRLRANRLLSLLANALGWLESGAQALVSWCTEKVVAMFTAIVGGFDRLTPFFESILQTVRRVISVVGDLMQLPSLVLGALWRLIPECIREPIKNFLVQQILGRIPVFGQFFTNSDLWTRVQQTALEILRQVFVDGDLARAAWTFFQAMLRVLGLPPELVVRILAKAAQAIGDVLRDPIGFLGNVLRAMRAGFGLFFDNVGTHLLNGFTGWLFGHLGSVGIRPPADFTLRSVLGFVLEIFGVTVENVFRRLSDRIGTEAVQRLRRMLDVATGVWEFVKILVEEGPAGLWREIQQRLANLWNTLVDGAINWITDRVIARATRWLMSLLDVTGIMPIINTLVAVYNAIESFVQYLREILEMVSRVLDGVINIAAGQIDEAAGFLERAMADSLPVAIGFLANQFGLGNIGQRIQELIAPVRERVDAAIDWLIERAINAGQAILNMVRRGATAVRGAVAAVREWWNQQFGFRGPRGEQHHIYFEGQRAQARVMVASYPQTFPQFLEEHAGRPAQGSQPAVPAHADYQEAYDTYHALLRLKETPAPGTETDNSGQIVTLSNRLAVLCERMLVDGDRNAAPSSAPVYLALRQGFGTQMDIARLTRNRPPGSGPGVSGGLWDKLVRRRTGDGTYYIRGHLLNHLIGGPGTTWANLTPLTRSANSLMETRFESAIKDRVDGSPGQQLRVSVRATERPTAPPVQSQELRSQNNANNDDPIIADVKEAEAGVPSLVDCKAWDVSQPVNATPIVHHEIANVINTTEEYQLNDAPKQPLYLSDRDESRLSDLSPRITNELADRIRKRTRSRFNTREQFEQDTGLDNSIWAEFASSARYRVRLYRRT